jgi:Mg-chelatase subunit ChlI
MNHEWGAAADSIIVFGGLPQEKEGIHHGSHRRKEWKGRMSDRKAGEEGKKKRKCKNQASHGKEEEEEEDDDDEDDDDDEEDEEEEEEEEEICLYRHTFRFPAGGSPPSELFSALNAIAIATTSSSNQEHKQTVNQNPLPLFFFRACEICTNFLLLRQN